MSVTPGPILELAAGVARRGIGPGINVPPTMNWANTGSLGREHDGDVRGIAGTAASGWAGSGTLVSPYRLVLPGSPAYVPVPFVGVTATKVFTLEAWLIAPTVPPSPEPPANPYYFIFTEAGEAVTTYPEVGLCIYAPDGPTPPGYARFFYRDQDGTSRTILGPGGTADICDGLLHHMLAVSDGAHGTLYVDGAAGEPVDVPPGTIGVSFTTVGAQSLGVPFHCLAGAVICCRMYSSALSAAQVAANYAAGPLAVAGTVQAQTITARPALSRHRGWR